MTKQIPLTQNQSATIDDWNYDWLVQWKWCAKWEPNTRSFYAVRYIGKSTCRKTISMAREIMHTPKGLLCDHINHDTLKNLEENLRNVTNSQNQINRAARRNKQLKEKNIYISYGNYEVKVTRSGMKTYCKYFKTLPEAIAARDEALKIYHGEFAFNYQPQEGA